MTAIELTINGKTQRTQAQTLAALLTELDFADKRIAVEVNGEIIPKGLHAKTPLQAQDRIEIVVAVGGG